VGAFCASVGCEDRLRPGREIMVDIVMWGDAEAVQGLNALKCRYSYELGEGISLHTRI